MSSGSSTSGSPPQVRGKLHQVNASRSSAGITPAGAGKTPLHGAYQRTVQDHPRRCGENFYKVGLAAYDTGSPPQVRGKPVNLRLIAAAAGITPAGAGKTGHSVAATVQQKDHPRRCGENQSPTLRPRGFGGSPPQVRGKLQVRKFAHISLRITPAGAGKTPSALFVVLSAWDHPRRCGENVNSPVQRLFATGSPPQVRGKHSNGFGQDGWWRITPAGAGKTRISCLRILLQKDHPRRCGENLHKETVWAAAQGSPPQVRGQQIALLVGRGSPWITPAGAGKT